MKTKTFKKIIKEAVKEAFQEEIKTFLIEALSQGKAPINEKKEISKSTLTESEKRKLYLDMIDQTEISLTTKDLPQFSPLGGMDIINGTLPSGEVSMDVIKQLIGK